jgi:hypothetical protein
MFHISEPRVGAFSYFVYSVSFNSYGQVRCGGDGTDFTGWAFTPDITHGTWYHVRFELMDDRCLLTLAGLFSGEPGILVLQNGPPALPPCQAVFFSCCAGRLFAPTNTHAADIDNVSINPL